ncbi:MAG: DNA polymerase III subunit beta [Ignavibacteria bacterium GWB2_35_12]|nr:MAG: DNA polymerase III subunit beta [Ignavibacteria bacterium GWA2_35_8]OGU39392.1 MAG: DNA polymerase III subunit beta [Ignavibacteria bacterium GWB2_35_12]OGU96802.1 MAG: DNA polymerase III subunit beta [Ignavibacteria bacterium RIFOXYA2_FULL_35_10]OGV21094.1 MAG: DNA polymerase III subunit beta [Ignavibacteria bacterium RIFOXYC2_FULL_35_21]
MKFSVALPEFQKALQKNLPAIPRKSTLPVLEHLHFSLSGNELRVVSTDQDITIMSHLNVSGAEDGSILVPGRKIGDLVKTLSEGQLDFSANESTNEIKLKTSTGKYTLRGLSTSEYLDIPELFESEKPDLEKVKISEKSGKAPAMYFSKDNISWLADKTHYAVSTDEFRPAMNGVLFQFRENFITAVSTDSYRLVKAVVHADKGSYPNELDLIIPARAIELLRKVDNEVVMSVIETRNRITHARFDVGDTVFITRLIDEKFPPYESVIPQNNELSATVNQKDVINAINRVAQCTSELNHQIKMVIEKNNISISGQDEDSGSEGDEVITCDFSGNKVTIGFNYKYLYDAISNIDTDDEKQAVLMTFSEPTRPVLIKPGKEELDLLMLIMPVRLT